MGSLATPPPAFLPPPPSLLSPVARAQWRGGEESRRSHFQANGQCGRRRQDPQACMGRCPSTRGGRVGGLPLSPRFSSHGKEGAERGTPSPPSPLGEDGPAPASGVRARHQQHGHPHRHDDSPLRDRGALRGPPPGGHAGRLPRGQRRGRRAGPQPLHPPRVCIGPFPPWRPPPHPLSHSRGLRLGGGFQTLG